MDLVSRAMVRTVAFWEVSFSRCVGFGAHGAVSAMRWSSGPGSKPNHQTPHGGLGGMTPLDRFLQEQALIRQAPEQLELWLRMKVDRKVSRDRTVHLDSRLYEAPDGFAGETIEVLYDPYDPGRPVHFRHRGETAEQPLRRLDLVTNATLRRAARESQTAEPQAPTTGISYLDLIAKKFFQEEP
jgi:hypothetical protein